MVTVIAWLGTVRCACRGAACTSNAQSSDIQYNVHEYTKLTDLLQEVQAIVECFLRLGEVLEKSLGVLTLMESIQ